MAMARVKQQIIQGPFVAQQQQSLRIRIQPADGMNAGRKIKFRQRPVGRAVAGELR
jgi:hypothetical protein